MACRHLDFVKFGYLRDGTPRFRCKICAATFISRAPKGRYIDESRQTTLRYLLERGFSLRRSALLSHISYATARSLRNEWKTSSLCPCGNISSHQGWCWWRYSRSESRQKFMKRWHERASKRKEQKHGRKN